MSHATGSHSKAHHHSVLTAPHLEITKTLLQAFTGNVETTFKSHHNYGTEKSKGSLMLLLHLSSKHIQILHSTSYHKEDQGILKLILANTPQNLSHLLPYFQERSLWLCSKALFLLTFQHKESRGGSASSSIILSWEKGVSLSTNNLQARSSCNLSNKNGALVYSDVLS